MASHTAEHGGHEGPRASGKSTATKAVKKAVEEYSGPAQEMGRDAMETGSEHTLVSLLLLGGIVIGGSLLVASMMQDEQPRSESQQPRAPRAVHTATNTLGPKGTQTLMRIRDAVLAFVMAKTVDTVEEMFPGFREHYDKA